INLTNGENIQSATRMRTDFIIVTSNDTLDWAGLDGDIKINIFTYDDNYNYINNTGWVSISGQRYNFKDNTFIKILIAYSDDKEITDIKSLYDKVLIKSWDYSRLINSELNNKQFL